MTNILLMDENSPHRLVPCWQSFVQTNTLLSMQTWTKCSECGFTETFCNNSIVLAAISSRYLQNKKYDYDECAWCATAQRWLRVSLVRDRVWKSKDQYKESCLVNRSSSSLHRATHFVGLLNLLPKATKPLRATQGHDSMSQIVFAHWFTSALPPTRNWKAVSLLHTAWCVCVCTCVYSKLELSVKSSMFPTAAFGFGVIVKQSFQWGIISVVELGRPAVWCTAPTQGAAEQSPFSSPHRNLVQRDSEGKHILLSPVPTTGILL